MEIPTELSKDEAKVRADLAAAKTDETRIVDGVKAEASKLKTLWATYKGEIIGIAVVVAFVAVIAYQLFKKVV